MEQGASLTYHGVDIHPTHRIAWYRGVLYCNRCGATIIARASSKLKQLCLLRPGTQAGENRLKSMKAGVYPGPDGWPLPPGSKIADEWMH